MTVYRVDDRSVDEGSALHGRPPSRPIVSERIFGAKITIALTIPSGVESGRRGLDRTLTLKRWLRGGKRLDIERKGV
jgi:hypothetical protein